MDELTDYFTRMAVSYLLSIAVETAVLVIALSHRHPLRHRLFAGLWLTACTYPVVWLILPPLFEDRRIYLLVAETFAAAAECVLFWLAFVWGRDAAVGSTARDMASVIAANLLSFGCGEMLRVLGFWG